eukprot:2141667-Alexandrium_andersonii.AAC.1
MPPPLDRPVECGTFATLHARARGGRQQRPGTPAYTRGHRALPTPSQPLHLGITHLARGRACPIPWAFRYHPGGPCSSSKHFVVVLLRT